MMHGAKFFRLFYIAALLITLSPLQARADELHTLMSGGQSRNYLLHLPPGWQSGRPGPVVVALHGMLQSEEGMNSYLGLNQVADREGFAVVYPHGLGNAWKDGRAPQLRMTFWSPPSDDVEFLAKLVANLTEKAIADPSRVYLTGLSNGGYMVYRMACERPELFAAFATLSATVPSTYVNSCKPARAVPVLMINGTADMIVPFYGNGLGGSMSLLPVTSTAKLFAKLNGCDKPAESPVPTRGGYGGTSVTLIYWNKCREQSAVVLFRVNGGGHQSPSIGEGRVTPMGLQMLGMRNHDIDAAEEVWAFFKHYDLSLTASIPAAEQRASIGFR
jgi:polyhydroxybutyrate depolymerase